MYERYYELIEKIDAARKAQDWKALRRYERQLEKWQAEYGAYAPVR